MVAAGTTWRICRFSPVRIDIYRSNCGRRDVEPCQGIAGDVRFLHLHDAWTGDPSVKPMQFVETFSINESPNSCRCAFRLDNGGHGPYVYHEVASVVTTVRPDFVLACGYDELKVRGQSL
jgi:hypothetical protein